MPAKQFALACTLALMAGCAGPSPAPELSADHPAHPDASTAPLPPRSTTLAVDAGGAAPAPITMPAAHNHAPVDGPVVYACPHHPEVTSDKPGQRCPKCGMLLVKREAAPAAGDPHEGHR